VVSLSRHNLHICFLIILLFLKIFNYLFLPTSAFANENCIKYTNVLIENKFDNTQTVTIQAEVADEPGERAKGLMNRKELAKSNGMLFVYYYPSAPQFWMKNTLIPLDILFSDQEGRIIKIFENVPRLSENTITAGEGVSFVLEINSGLIDEFEIDQTWNMDFSDFFKTAKPFC